MLLIDDNDARPCERVSAQRLLETVCKIVPALPSRWRSLDNVYCEHHWAFKLLAGCGWRVA